MFSFWVWNSNHSVHIRDVEGSRTYKLICLHWLSMRSGDFFLIEHPVTLEALYWNPQFSDVSFVVEGERFRAHKLVLATRCEYFRQGNASSYYLMIRYSYGIRLIFTAQSHALWRTERKLQSRNSAQGNKHPRLPHFAEVSMVLCSLKELGRLQCCSYTVQIHLHRKSRAHCIQLRAALGDSSPRSRIRAD